MQTGDLVIYKRSCTPTAWWLLDVVISLVTGAPWVHVGMVVKDPHWLQLKGTYLWESGWTGIEDGADHKKHFGVQLVPLNERIVPGSTYCRRYSGPTLDLEDAYNRLHGKPYDINPFDWLAAAIGWDPFPQRERRFWCSAFVACVLTTCNILPKTTDWTVVAPGFFARGLTQYYGAIHSLELPPQPQTEGPRE